jgi:hypothetical protein
MNAFVRGMIAAGWVRGGLGIPPFHVDQADYSELERLRDKLLDVDQILDDKIAETPTLKEWPGVREDWRGRFWIPTDGRVEPGRKQWLICNDGRVGRPILESFALGDTVRDTAVDQGDAQFA